MDEIQDTRLRVEPEPVEHDLYLECEGCCHVHEDQQYICCGCIRFYSFSSFRADLYAPEMSYGTHKLLIRRIK